MANIEIKRGQQTQVDIKYIPSGETYTKNFFNATTLGSATDKLFRHKASLVLRRKTNNSVQGELVDTLSTVDTVQASSSDLQSTSLILLKGSMTKHLIPLRFTSSAPLRKTSSSVYVVLLLFDALYY